MKIERSFLLILTVGLGLALGYAMTKALGYFSSPNQVTPTILLAVVSAPVAYLWLCISKLTDIKKVAGISKSEYRRLVPKISASCAYYWFKIVFIVICNAVIALAFFLAPSSLVVFEVPVIKIAVGTLGFMLVFGISSALECYVESLQIQEFEAKIARRELNKKLVEDSLSKLKPKDTKQPA